MRRIHRPTIAVVKKKKNEMKKAAPVLAKGKAKIIEVLKPVEKPYI